MDFDRNSIVQIFLGEVEENLTLAEDTTIELETRPDDIERVQALFRAVHTVKGGADSLGFEALTSLAHAIEDLLDDLRTGHSRVSSSLISLLLETFDAVRRSTDQIRATGGDSGSVPMALVRRIEQARAQHQVGESQRALLREGSSVPTAISNALLRRETVRVEMKKLDAALDLSGEISVALGRLEALVAALPGQTAEAVNVQHLVGRLHRELQDRVVALRMVPIGPTLRGFIRTVRDVAALQGKQARLIVECGELTVDANVIERLREPMTHLVRNAIDHGIEANEQRVALGKEPQGRLLVRAWRDGGAIVVEFEDDGRGLSRKRIAERARTLGLLNGEPQTDDELLGLIFTPGFSTAERLSDLSGRGMGMDAVKRAVEALRGTVQVSSVEGVGTTVTLRMPVSLALLDGFSVTADSEIFVLPREAMRECLAFADSEKSVGVLEVRGKSLPYVCLRTLFGDDSPSPRKKRNLVVIECAGAELGLVVDEVLGDIKVVVKPLGPVFRNVRAVMGCAVSGDGSVALVLDIAGVFAAAVRRRAVRPLAIAPGLQ